MGMLLTCLSKGCYVQDYHKLDKETNQVLCVACGNAVNVTQYVKTSLATQGQIMRKPKPNMEVKCPSCGSGDGPVLLKYSKTDYKIGCKVCKEPNAHLTKYFLNAFKMKSDTEIVEVNGDPTSVEEAPLSKTAEGAVVINKPFSAVVNTPQRKLKVSKAAEVVFYKEPEDLSEDGSTSRPKIAIAKKDKITASQTAEALRHKFVDPDTGDVSEEMKSTLEINKA